MCHHLSISSIAELVTMKAYKMPILLLMRLLGSCCIIEADENCTAVSDNNDDGSGFEDDNDSGNSFFDQI